MENSIQPEIREVPRDTPEDIKAPEKTVVERYTVPIYEADLWFIFSHDIDRERVYYANMFGKLEGRGYTALCAWNGVGNFALFFDYKHLTHEIVAHEVFHLSHRISDWSGLNFDPQHHEATAQLCGYLTKLLYDVIAKNKIELTTPKVSNEGK